MKHSARTIIVFCAMAAFAWPGCANLRAEESGGLAPVGNPEGPLLKGAPEYSRWIIDFVNPPAKPGSGQNLGDADAKRVVTKTQHVIHEEVFDGRGCSIDTWFLGPQQYRKPHGKDVWYVSEPARNNNAADSEYDPLPASGFRGWEWVAKDAFVGQIDLQGRICFAFVPGGPRKLGDTSSKELKELLEAQPDVAFVDAGTRLPVALRKGGITQNYRFETIPTALQKLPPALVDQIKKTEEARARLMQPAPRPY